MMTMQSRNEYLQTIKEQYLKTKSREEKSRLLDEYCRNTEQNRKYAIRKLQPRVSSSPKQRKKRRCLYDNQAIYQLQKIWRIMDFPCGQRLQPILKDLVDILRKNKELDISDELAQKLKKIKSATIDRRLTHARKEEHRKHFSTTRPGSFFKNRIPVRLNDWDTSEIGNIALDLVAHCGTNTAGDYGNTISCTDIATGWWEGEAILGKAQQRTCNGADKARDRFPFKWKGIHPDNDTPFLNAHMLRYTEKENLEFTRSRPNKKNDNAYIEQKNWTHVRKLIGYQRYDTEEELEIINDLYRKELHLYKNFFQPILKLKEKIREGGKLHRRYEMAKTPYQRVLELGRLSRKEKERLQKIYASLNPAELKRGIDEKLRKLSKIHEQKFAAAQKISYQIPQTFQRKEVARSVTF